MEYTTRDGSYTYKFLPKDFDLDEHQDTLDQAVKYTRVKVIYLSRGYVEHLKEKLSMVESQEIFGEYKFYYKLREGTIQLYRNPNDTYYALLWVDQDENTTEREIFNDVFQYTPFMKEGLHHYLDPNCGGSVDNISIERANYIIYG